MIQEEVNKLLAEIIESKGFINIDSSDIHTFKEGIDFVDGIKVSGRGEDVGELISDSISTLIENNKGKIIRKLLFIIRFPVEKCFMIKNMSKVHEALDILGEDVECVWGISTSDNLTEGSVETILFVGLQNNL